MVLLLNALSVPPLTKYARASTPISATAGTR
jgi:hypothetical protein